MEQQMEALARGNEIRLAHAALRERIAKLSRQKGQRLVASIIRDTDDEACLRARLGYLMESIRYQGPSYTAARLQLVGLTANQRLGDLTQRQRTALARAVTRRPFETVTMRQHGFVDVVA